jgi:hypothetical protein
MVLSNININLNLKIVDKIKIKKKFKRLDQIKIIKIKNYEESEN